MPDETVAESSGPEPVSILGCGLMGSALARAMAAAGHTVTVWNRTEAKAAAVARLERVTAAGSINDAVAASSMLLLIVSDYAAAAECLDAVANPAALAGKTIVNLISGTPDAATRFEARVTAHGAMYLDGSIAAYPADIGNAATMIAYAGSRDAWDTARPALRALAGRSEHLSDAVGAANAFEAVIGAYYMVAWAGYLEAAAYANVHGLTPGGLLAGVDYLTDLLRSSIREATSAIEREDYSTDQATVDVFVDAVRNYHDGMRRSGHPARMTEALKQSLDQAQADGWGKQGFHILFKSAARAAPTHV
jgi:3-hydroxyisobutyrate dehydrogenase-like beta-hydroxyacid dehydrogenase